MAEEILNELDTEEDSWEDEAPEGAAGDTTPEAGAQETEEDQDAASGGAEQSAGTQGETPQQITLKYLHGERQVSLEEARVLAQKGLDYDRIKQDRETLRQEKQATDETLSVLRAAAEKAGFSDLDSYLEHYQVQQLMLDRGMDESAAREQVALQRREAALERKSAQLDAKEQALNAGEQEKQAAQQRRQAEIEQFVKAFPELDYKTIPSEVFRQAEESGEGLLNAYLRHENQRLSAQLAAEKQASENQGRSPGSRDGVGDGNDKDDFLAGFEMDD